MNIVKYALSLLVSIFMMSNTCVAETPTDLLQGYQQQAKIENPTFTAFNAARGQQFFNNKHGNDWSCSSCHTTNPKQMGKHDLTGRTIQPMAPVANPQRFTDRAKSEKWFRRNCKDVLSRECSAQEKGDVITYLLSIK
jgi:hypothetical protein